MLPHVGLITDYFVMVRNPRGAELDTGVGFGGIAEQFDFQPKLEIIVFLCRAKEFVMREAVFQRAAGDRAVLYAEDTLVPFPAFELFTVEQFLCAALKSAGGYDQKREKNDREWDEFTTG